MTRAILICVCIGLSASSVAAPLPLDCASVLRQLRAQPGSNKYAYHSIGTVAESSLRCEGSFTQQQAALGDAFAVASLLLKPVALPIAASTVLYIRAGATLAPAPPALAVVAMPLDLARTYRMDAQISADTELRWTAKESLAAHVASTSELGFFARSTIGSHSYYIPLSVTSKTDAMQAIATDPPSEVYELTLRFSRACKRVWYRTIQCSSDGTCAGSYSSHQPVTSLSASTARIRLAPQPSPITGLRVLSESIDGLRDENREPILLALGPAAQSN